LELSLELRAMFEAFAIDGDLVEAAPYGSGHIHDTFLAVYRNRGGESRYIHQRLNRRVFPRSDVVMRNIAAVTRHVRKRLVAEATDDLDRRVLSLVPTRDGSDYTVDAQGDWWRTYVFIARARSIDTAEAPAQAFQAARAFGDFQRLLLDYDGPEVAETIPRFHHTRSRFEDFRRVLAADTAGRASAAADEVRFALAHEGLVDRLLDMEARGEARTRLTHNDTKLNNVLLDETTGQGLCVIDLDTVMPGLPLYDFGDMVRTATATAAEDERDLSRVSVDEDLFEAVTAGYLSSAGALLSAAEKEHLTFAARLIVFEIGLRFLTDYLEGDVYFKVHRPGHNLDRCRTQFKMVRVLEEREDRFREIAERAAATAREPR
jgi:aminoglycoside phosphotransferase (APT) family kinase protein